ncbi:ornithine cyclodeaminase [Roseibium hamelinense]|uniref:Ornithine cyclodeaminase n=1 Tax=Roseibium hamelinense TaxID=150831 RepID=A0A562SMG1_9HYPH|nr:cyclodeaminase [Roseibium hamelinense]MTI45096.1 cyclodeaminase [Roseibium hamelinense]TWI82363.1 ornithine cyclodeaminase [Roseibium hamelinense]
MSEISILTEADLRRVISLDTASVDCIETAFHLLATEKVVMPPVLSFHIPEHNGEIDVKTAYVPGIDSFAIKMSPGFFDNPKLGLPSLNGLMVLFSSHTGLVEALLLDNGYLTDVRTAAAGGVAAKWLSRKDSKSVGILGAGTQARLQLKALTLVREIEEAFVWARDPAKASAFSERCAKDLGIPVRSAATIDEVAEQSDILVTTTPSKESLLSAKHLRRGMHVTAMGSDADYKNELAPEVVSKADLFACDRLEQSRTRGELRAALAAGVVAPDAAFPELGEIIAMGKSGRQSNDEITVCDLTGTGVQDTAIATLARSRATTAGAGTRFQS